jgi:hypothetical protein
LEKALDIFGIDVENNNRPGYRRVDRRIYRLSFEERRPKGSTQLIPEPDSLITGCGRMRKSSSWKRQTSDTLTRRL